MQLKFRLTATLQWLKFFLASRVDNEAAGNQLIYREHRGVLMNHLCGPNKINIVTKISVGEFVDNQLNFWSEPDFVTGTELCCVDE